MPESRPLPTEAEVEKYIQTCNNWGRWSAEDSAGTINLITPEVRQKAALAVRSGRAVSIARQWNTVGGPGNWNPAQHYIRHLGELGSGDYIGIFFHGYATTHIDALCHIFWDGQMYNGKPASDVTTTGARCGSVDAWSDGMTTRGVLIDIPRFRGVDFVELGEPVRGWELEAAAKQQGVEPRPGDAILVYSGREKYNAVHPDRAPGTRPSAGLHVDVCPVLKQWDAAILGWDMMDAAPSGYELFARRGDLSVHFITIVFMGMPLLDNAILQPLAEACAEEGKYDFLLTINPLNIKGGTGSPVNPIAIL